MSRKVFLVCGNEVYETGHPVDNKIVVIEAEIDDEGRYATVIAPQAFVEKWPTVKVAGSMEAWVECDGPARLLTHQEWLELLPLTRPVAPHATYKAVILTVEGKPTFDVPVDWVASDVDNYVLRRFGRQPNGNPHNWRGEHK